MGREIEIPRAAESSGSQSESHRSADVVQPQATAGAPPVPTLPAEEQRYLTLIEQLPAILYISDYGEDGRCYFVSPKIQELLGFEPNDWIENTRFWMERMHPDDRRRALDEEEEARRTGNNLRCEYRLQHRDGRYLWFRDEAVPLPRSDGPPLLHGVLYDIHESKLTENALRQAEARYREVIEKLPAAAYIADFNPDAPWKYVSPQIETLLGVSQKEWLKKAGMWLAFVHPDDRQLVNAATAQIRVQAGPFRMEYRMLARDGHVLWIQDEGTVAGDIAGKPELIHSILTDITERKKKEQLLSESEQRLRLALEASGMGTFDMDAHSGGVSWDSRNGQLFQLPEELMGRPFRELLFRVHPEDRPLIVSNVERALTTGSAVHMEFRIILDDGSVEWRSVHGKAIRDASGEIVRISGIGEGISERKRAEEALQRSVTERELAQKALRESEMRLRLTLHAAGMGVWEWDAASNLITWDLSLHQILGISPGEFDGRPESLMAWIHPEDRQKFVDAMERAAGTGEIYHLDFRLVRRDGRTLWISDQGRPEFDSNGKLVRYRGVARDVTQRRELQEQLQRAQKMEAIGQLAGGVAHDFNNLLTVIRGNTEALLEQAAANPAFRNNAEAVLMAADRAAGITRQLLAFSRQQVMQPTVLELGGVVSETASLLRRLLGPTVKLELQLAAESLHVRADANQLEQVVLNLVINARDAMPEGGTVTVSMDAAAKGSEAVRRYPQMRDADYVRLAVRDTGIGMDAATQARIFEPFFTTKAHGKGTGLGLATVYGIVKQSDGWIWADSAPGKGACFEVFLPEVPAPTAVAQAPTQRGMGLRGTETLLLVDDELDIRRLLTEFLGGLGYQVIEAASGEEALEKAGLHKGAIHVLITDALMPGMQGLELAQRLRATRTIGKVLYISGYAEETGILSHLPRDGEEFLQKPFGLTELAVKIRELLQALS